MATELVIGGMTCASCAARIEKKLNRMDGVEASVNYATEKALVNGTAAVQDLIATVEKMGYTARLPEPPEEEEAEPEDTETRSLRTRLLVSVALTIPVVAMSMVQAFQFEYWQWAALTLTAPVVVWGALPFHRAAWLNARHGAATMDTLISMGTLAAFAWSVYALFLGTAGIPGMEHPFRITIERTGGTGNIYLEVAAGVTTFILAGRYFEARAKNRAGSALRALLSLGVKDVAVLRDGTETRVPIDRLAVSRASPSRSRSPPVTGSRARP
jgi:Cu+-exporting ATPase